MNVIEMLGKSAENNHGRELSATQVKEIIVILQAMQMQIAQDQSQLDAQTRILAASLDQHGGALDISSTMFAEAERYVVEAVWDAEKDVIHARVAVPKVSEEDAATEGSGLSVVSVSDDEDGGSLAGEEDGDEEGQE
jgi:hypothetical protein